MVLLDCKTVVDNKTNKVEKIDFTFALPDKVNTLTDTNGEFLFCGRMRQKKTGGEFIPIKAGNGEARFIARRTVANSSRYVSYKSGMAMDSEKKIVTGVGTLKQLEAGDNKAWKQ